VSSIRTFVDLQVTTPICMFAEQLQIATPHTFNALQRLVTTMAETVKNANKKTLFGRDKGVESYSRFLTSLKSTVQAMVIDGIVGEATPTDEVLHKLEEKLVKFAMAFPNWKDAYSFAGMFLGEHRADAIATVERLRSMP
jgi:hypothetical protein